MKSEKESLMLFSLLFTSVLLCMRFFFKEMRCCYCCRLCTRGRREGNPRVPVIELTEWRRVENCDAANFMPFLPCFYFLSHYDSKLLKRWQKRPCCGSHPFSLREFPNFRFTLRFNLILFQRLRVETFFFLRFFFLSIVAFASPFFHHFICFFVVSLTLSCLKHIHANEEDTYNQSNMWQL